MKIDEADIIASKILREGMEYQKKSSFNLTDILQVLIFITGIYSLNRVGDLMKKVRPRLYEAISNFLSLSSSSNYNNSIERTFQDVIDGLFEILGGGSLYRIPIPERQLGEIRHIVLHHLTYVYSSENDYVDPILIFDSIFRRHLEIDYSNEYRNGPRNAQMMYSLFGRSESIWEYFMCFGDASLLTLRHSHSKAYGTHFPAHEFLLRFKLWIHNIELIQIPENSYPPNSLLYVSHPNNSTSVPERALVDFSPARSALAALFKISKIKESQREIFSHGIAVIPGIDRTAAGWRGRLRCEIVESGRLQAIIDMPILGTSGKKTTVSIWVFGEASRSSEILCIDSSKLPRKEFSSDRDALEIAETQFVSAIVNEWRRQHKLDSTNSSDLEHSYARLYNEYFLNGYNDIPGICRSVSKHDIARQKYGLRANLYLQSTSQRDFFSAIDSTPLLKEIDRPDNQVFCAYIIGNNGAGKSLLLRELINSLLQRNYKSVGIAFGPTDRFPFQATQYRDNEFLYRGARTGVSGINQPNAAKQLAKFIKEIHVNQIKLDIFIESMSVLGFERRHYLVPKDFPIGEEEHTNENLSELILLTDDAGLNAGMLASARQKQHQLGLMRSTEKGRVALFNTLSSGEQQILTLVIKLLADAQPRTVMLIDEPEISLHVSWQRALPPILALISQRTGCSMVVATHSPVVVASATNDSDLRFVAKNDGLVALPVKSSQSVDTVLFDDFETYTENNRRIHERCAGIVAEIINEINTATSYSSNRILKLREELNTMKIIVNPLQSANVTAQRNYDLDMIRRADLAIVEILAQGNQQSDVNLADVDEDVE